MAPSRVGASIKSARERLGWSRETLAHQSGLSWAAITQIESGRRQEVRVSSLIALSGALGVSVDYLVGSATTVYPRLLDHRALICGSDDEYLASAVPFLVEGLERSDAVLAAPSKDQGELLRDAMGDDVKHIEFLDSSAWYSSLGGASNGYRTLVKQRFERGAPWVRILGDAAWAARSAPEEVAEWFRYESLINVSMESSPATIVCSYDSRSVPDSVLASARQTHPEVVAADDVTANPAYRNPDTFLLPLD